MTKRQKQLRREIIFREWEILRKELSLIDLKEIFDSIKNLKLITVYRFINIERSEKK